MSVLTMHDDADFRSCDDIIQLFNAVNFSFSADAGKYVSRVARSFSRLYE